jgi:hypothetical protein
MYLIRGKNETIRGPSLVVITEKGKTETMALYMKRHDEADPQSLSPAGPTETLTPVLPASDGLLQSAYCGLGAL